jgi:hypothetical protein
MAPSLERLPIDPERLGAHPAGGGDDVSDGPVAFVHQRQLATREPQPGPAGDHLRHQRRGHAGGTPRRANAEHHHPASADAARAEREPDESEGPEIAANAGQQRAQLRQRERESNRLTPLLRDQDQLRPVERPEVLRPPPEVLPPDRKESPGVVERLVVEPVEQTKLVAPRGGSHRADRDPGGGSRPRRAERHRRKPGLAAPPIRMLIEPRTAPLLLEQAPVIRVVHGSQEGGRLLVTFDQQPHLVVEGEPHRAEHRARTATAQGGGRRRQQRLRHRGIVHGLEAAESARRRRPALREGRVIERRDATDRLPAPPGDEPPHVPPLERRVACRIPPAPLVAPERSRPARHAAVEPIGEGPERPMRAATADRRDPHWGEHGESLRRQPGAVNAGMAGRTSLARRSTATIIGPTRPR